MAPTETQAVAPVPPEDMQTQPTTELPSFDEIFNIKEEGLKSDFSRLKYEDKTRIIDDARQEYQVVFGFDKLTGQPKVPDSYKKEFQELQNQNSPLVRNQTLESFAYNKFFKEQYLPKVQMGYDEPYAVTQARRAINHQRSIGSEEGVNQAKQILKDLGYNPNDYDL
tara:strand:- start:3700 stop:4200 length:501 start_codon:yes stop_codon:yes gene_type:complete